MKLRPSLILICIALAGAVSMSSCVKSYTCHCDITYSGVPGLPDSTNQEYTISNIKSTAQNECANASGTFTNTTQSPEQGTIKTKENCYLY